MLEEYDYHKKQRNTWAINREANKRVFEDKVRKNYKRVYDFVEKEIAKGMLPYPAIEKVLNSAGLEKLCPELKDDKVRRTVRTTLLNYYFKGPNKEKKIEEGDER